MPNKTIYSKLLSGLVDRQESSWDRRTISRDEEGKEVVETERVTHYVVRYPLAHNVSEDSVERAARRWLL